LDRESAVTLTGTVEDVVFYNEDNGYIVVDLDCGGELVTVVGNLGDVREGESLTLLGEYINSPKYGRQFKAEVCERSLPNTESAVRKFLGSGVIAGIGPAMAKRIVTAFGSRTLEMIENDPGQLSSIKGISPESAKKIGEDFRRIAGLRKAVTYFARYGLSPSVVALAWKKYELNTVQAVEDNPWCLCGMGIELPFREADRVARDMDFPMDSEERILAGILWCLRENANNGHTCITENDLSDRVTYELQVNEKQFWNGLMMAEERGDITRCDKYDDKYVFLTEYYRAECSIAEKLAEMIKRSDGGEVDFSQEIAGVELEQGIRYEALQREAINGCMNNHVFILTGGPGTGKTTTLNAVISLCRKRGLKMKLAAPTGRAAKRMADLTGAPAQTIHRLLEVDFSSKSHAFKRREDNPLTCDVLIIDEMSMVDTLLMDSLLKAIRPRTRLIMVGDSNQLPSVGAGNILRDLISSGRVPAVELKEIFRQAAQSLIVTNAHRIVDGEMPILNRPPQRFLLYGVCLRGGHAAPGSRPVQAQAPGKLRLFAAGGYTGSVSVEDRRGWHAEHQQGASACPESSGKGAFRGEIRKHSVPQRRQDNADPQRLRRRVAQGRGAFPRYLQRGYRAYTHRRQGQQPPGDRFRRAQGYLRRGDDEEDRARLCGDDT